MERKSPCRYPVLLNSIRLKFTQAPYMVVTRSLWVVAVV